MKVVVSGASGLLGRAIVNDLESQSHEVYRLVRSSPCGDREIRWAPYEGDMDPAAFDGVQVLIHLSGESILSVPWTKKKKQAIRDSRLKTTEFLCRHLCELDNPPKTWLCASAIGFYGDRGDERCDEESPVGSGFISTLCQEWEAATAPAKACGIRVVNLRLGPVLSPEGGMLPMVSKLFRFGLGGIVGSGEQYLSWIAIQDVLGAVNTTLNAASLQGPVNIVAPNPVTNREFTKTLGRVLSRPAFMRSPAFAIRLATGELADEALLASTRVYPKRLVDAGYEFAQPELEGALRALLGR